MPHLIKHNTSPESQSLRKGRFNIGVGDVAKDPTWYTGWDAPPGGYVVYEHKASGGPSIVVAENDAAMIGIANRITNSNYENLPAALDGLTNLGQPDKLVIDRQHPNIVTQGLVMNHVAFYAPSYPRTGTSWYDTSQSGNGGVFSSVPTNWSSLGWFVFDGTLNVEIVNAASLQVTGDQTLEFLVRPDIRGPGTNDRKNWYNKAYGGEGTITYEIDGSLNYFWGTAGGNNSPYQTVSTNGTPLAVTGTWYHVALVRELSTATKTVKWYINGVLNNSTSASYNAAVASNLPVKLGNGYAGGFSGGMAYARQYNIALSAAQISHNYYGGPIVTSGLAVAYDPNHLVCYQSGGSTATSLTGTNANSALTSVSLVNRSFNFNRSSDSRMTITSLDLTTTNAVSIELWVNFKTLPTTTSSGDYTRVICELSDNFNNFNDVFGLTVEWELTGYRWMLYENGNAGYNIKSLVTPLPAAGVWHHFVGIIDHTQSASNIISFYINGVAQNNKGGAGGQTYNAANTNSFGNRIFRIGGRATTSYSQDMYLGAFRIYRRAITAAEVLQNFNAQRLQYGL